MKKILILVRHAHALPGYIAQVATDDLRPLSEQGFQKSDLTAHCLKQLNLHPQCILTSPLLRAVQTAQTLGKILNAPVEQTLVLNGLKPEREVCDFLQKQLEKNDVIAAVSHNPSISYVAHLLTGNVYTFAPGSFAVIEFDDKRQPCQITFGE